MARQSLSKWCSDNVSKNCNRTEMKNVEPVWRHYCVSLGGNNGEIVIKGCCIRLCGILRVLSKWVICLEVKNVVNSRRKIVFAVGELWRREWGEEMSANVRCAVVGYWRYWFRNQLQHNLRLKRFLWHYPIMEKFQKYTSWAEIMKETIEMMKKWLLKAFWNMKELN